MNIENKNEAFYYWGLKTYTTDSWCFINNVFNKNEVENICKIGESYQKYDALVYGIKDNNGLDTNQRKTTISWIPSNDPENHWIFRKITDAIDFANKTHFNFDLTMIESLQYSIYNEGDFFEYHLDSGNDSAMGVRKLSFSILLSDPEEYEGGDLNLMFGKNPTVPKKTKGMIIFFPSHTLHRVTPITRGTRKALVGWVLGPNFK